MFNFSVNNNCLYIELRSEQNNKMKQTIRDQDSEFKRSSASRAGAKFG